MLSEVLFKDKCARQLLSYGHGFKSDSNLKFSGANALFSLFSATDVLLIKLTCPWLLFLVPVEEAYIHVNCPSVLDFS